MAKASDNVFPKLIISEGTAPAAAAAGQQKLFLDSADHKLKRINSTGTVTTVEGGGGGGTSSGYPPGSADVPPTVANAKDDEFDGTTSVTWSNGPFAPSSWSVNGTRASHAVMNSNGNGNNLATKVQAVPGSYPYTITAKLSGHNARLANNTVGLILAPTAPVSTSPVLILGMQASATALQVQRLSWSNHTSSFTSGTTGVTWTYTSGQVPKNIIGTPIYLRMVVASAASVTSQISPDGWNWTTFESAFNPGFTPGVMGVGVDEFGTADLTAHFDFFRVT